MARICVRDGPGERQRALMEDGGAASRQTLHGVISVGLGRPYGVPVAGRPPVGEPERNDTTGDEQPQDPSDLTGGHCVENRMADGSVHRGVPLEALVDEDVTTHWPGA